MANRLGLSHYCYLVMSDLYRHCGNTRWRSLIYHLAWVPGFKYMFWLRTAAFTRHHVTLWFFHAIARLALRKLSFRYGIQISYDTDIGPGFYIGHWGTIVVHSKVRIGRNCNISHDVTIGMTFGGKNPGCPVLGNNVYVASGARILGNISIGNGAAVGANAVVTKSIHDMAVAVGIPAQVRSSEGSGNYVVNTEFAANHSSTT
jgi:serine O-acetyltransferase